MTNYPLRIAPRPRKLEGPSENRSNYENSKIHLHRMIKSKDIDIILKETRPKKELT